MGIEANLIGMGGELDIDEAHLDMLDVLVAGFHLTPFGKKFGDNFKLMLPAWVGQIKDQSKKRIEKNTEAYLNMIKRYPVDIISHPAYILKLDYYKVAKAAAEYGTFIEISSRHKELTEDNLREMLKTDCKFVLNSDAHLPENVGKAEHALRMVESLNIPKERIVNAFEELPDFRLARAKREKDEHNKKN
jgi:putative hydrolase